MSAHRLPSHDLEVPPHDDVDAPPVEPRWNGSHRPTGQRVPPHDVEAEESLLGAMLLSRDAITSAVEIVAPTDFYKPAHRSVFSAIVNLSARGEPADPVTVTDELSRTGLLEVVGGPGILVALQVSTVSTGAAGRYARIVRELATCRRMIEVGDEIAALGWSAPHDVTDAVARVVDLAEGLDGARGTTPAPCGLLPASIHWSAFWEKDRTAEDWLLEPYLPRGRMTAVWADRKAGKSLLSLEVAAALATGRPILGRWRSTPMHVAYFDMEMTEDDLSERLEDMGYGADVDLSRLHYYLLPSLPPLDTAEGGSAVEAIVVRDRAEVVVFDTMARVVQGDENESTTYRSFYQHTGLRLKMRGVTGLRLDHSGKDPTKGARGSSAKGDDIDVGWELKVAEDGAVILNRKLTRVSWVPDRVALRRLSDPLRHVLAAGPVWPAGTKDTAEELDRLAVPVTASCTTAMASLKEDGQGRRKGVVLAALKWRRQLAEEAAQTSGTTPGTGPSDTTPEPVREPQGDAA